jgi:hypothetical protein
MPNLLDGYKVTAGDLDAEYGMVSWIGSYSLGIIHRSLPPRLGKTFWSDTTGKGIRFPEGLVPIIEMSFASSTWTHLQEHLRRSPFTLTHGDFHAANIILNLPRKKKYDVHDLLRGDETFGLVGDWTLGTND